MKHPPLAPGWIDRPHHQHDLGNFLLESGQTIRDAQVSYVLHGDPVHLKDRAILVTTSIGGTHHRLDFLIGPGNALDTERFCVVAVDALGNGLSSSPSTSTSQPRSLFPRFGMRDMVASQSRLLDALSVGKLVAVVGASMGGMQAVQWGVSNPGRMAGIVAMTPMAKTSRWSQLVNELTRRAFFMDAACVVPRPRKDALTLWTPLTELVMVRTPQSLAAFASQGELLEWIETRGRDLLGHGPDPFDWCHQTWAYDAHDVGLTPGFNGDTKAALRQIRAAVIAFAPSCDLYNPPEEARSMCDVIPGAEFVELPGHEGHKSASGLFEEPTAVLRSRIREFMASMVADTA
ncbi:MAG: alpha/beta fold hydrolase [Burkholderiales bacterium]